ncbi:hypothetical protein WMY93_030839 [Mugilogobius chulae]|uniref:Uncharacterized protein n=1 Tax=Mugilogobius chulae TaxID=88201 RepID=A0AAW0MHS7_9GOBI
MLAGGHRLEELISPACPPHLTNVKTLISARVTVGPCPTSVPLDAHQNMVACSHPLPWNGQGFAQAQLLANSSNKPVNPGQQTLLLQGQMSNIPSDVGIASTNKKLLPKPSSNDSLQRTQTSANTSDSFSSTTARPPGCRPYLSDEEILALISQKLEIFRAQMKALKGQVPTDGDFLDGKPSCSRQDATCNMPVSSELAKTGSYGVASIREKEPSASGSKIPEGPQMESAPTAKHSKEFDRTMLETAAACAKRTVHSF